MDGILLLTAMTDDLSAGDVIIFEGEHHQIVGECEDDGDMIMYRSINLDGGEDDVILEPGVSIDVWDVS